MSIDYTVPWHALPDDPSQRDGLLADLRRELVSSHPLFGLPAVAVARRQDCDDVLFQVGVPPYKYAVVHLTWSGKAEQAPDYPWTTIFDSFNQFTEMMKQDALDFG
jgi:hypothetical protein